MEERALGGLKNSISLAVKKTALHANRFGEK